MVKILALCKTWVNGAWRNGVTREVNKQNVAGNFPGLVGCAEGFNAKKPPFDSCITVSIGPLRGH